MLRIAEADGLTESIVESLDDCKLDIYRDFGTARKVIAEEKARALSYLNGICVDE